VTLKLLLMGTGEFAVPAFEALLAGPHEVVGLVTQPDRSGPGHHDHRHPLETIKAVCVDRGLPVLQPTNVNLEESIESIAVLEPDLAVVAAYGQILKPGVIGLPRLGAFNLHASLLPRHRGATPIHHAILAGDSETGVTAFLIAPEVDSGPILGSVRRSISPSDTTGTLHDALAEDAAGLAVDVVDLAARTGFGNTLQSQDDANATLAPRLKKADAEIDWSVDGVSIDRHIRAMRPWPNPFTHLHIEGQKSKRLIVCQVEPCPGSRQETVKRVAGDIVSADPASGLLVACGDGLVRVLRVQPAGRREMDSDEFLRGAGEIAGGRLGPA
tara:strand:+ start:1036 stop:2019 length:984 start_codon:yes stop_codon:yes gene_type:complete